MTKLIQGENDFKTWCLNNGDYGKKLLSEFVGIEVKTDENGQEIELECFAWNVLPGSNKKVKWKCTECNNEWTAAIGARTHLKGGCLYCKSLYTWCLSNGDWGQQILNEWTGLDENNQPISMYSIVRGSGKAVKWKCSKCGNEWVATINNRTGNKTGCPDCSLVGTSFPEQFLFFALKQIFPSIKSREILFKESTETKRGLEYDIYIPEINLCIEYNGEYFHAEKEERDKLKEEMCKKNSIKFFQITECDSRQKERFKAETNFETEGNKIRFYTTSYKDKNNKLKWILEYILKKLNCEYKIDFNKALKDAEAEIDKLKSKNNEPNDNQNESEQNNDKPKITN